MPAHASARLEPEHLESYVLPARGLWCDLDQGAALVRLAFGGNEQVWHEEKLPSRGVLFLIHDSNFTIHTADSVSLLENYVQVGETPAHLSGRTVARVGGQHYVLF